MLIHGPLIGQRIQTIRLSFEMTAGKPNMFIRFFFFILPVAEMGGTPRLAHIDVLDRFDLSRL